jgi:alkylation response protein AidB-like acyl-CoA dehydrogenase
MDFHLDDQQEMFRSSTRGVLKRISPIKECRRLLHDPLGYDPGVWTQAAEHGWIALGIPERFGGLGGSVVDLAVLAQELGRVAYCGPLLATILVADAVSRWGTDTQRTKILPPLIAGSRIATWAAVEDGHTWDADSISLEAEANPEGFRLNGTKTAVPYAHVANDVLILASVKGALTHFVLPSREPEVTFSAMSTVDITARQARLRVANAYVGADGILGDVGGGVDQLRYLQNLAATLLCADAVGGAEEMLQRTVQYATDRHAFGLPIGGYQIIKHKCADMLIWLRSAEVATYAAAVAMTDAPQEADRAVSIAKSYVGDALGRLMLESLQIHGGVGYTWEHDLHLYLRRHRSTSSLYGDVTWHRDRIARGASRPYLRLGGHDLAERSSEHIPADPHAPC